MGKWGGAVGEKIPSKAAAFPHQGIHNIFKEGAIPLHKISWPRLKSSLFSLACIILSSLLSLKSNFQLSVLINLSRGHHDNYLSFPLPPGGCIIEVDDYLQVTSWQFCLCSPGSWRPASPNPPVSCRQTPLTSHRNTAYFQINM